MSDLLLENRDYTIIIAKTAESPLAPPVPGFANRWAAAHDAILALAKKCEEFDPDGITVYISSTASDQGSFQQYKQVKMEELPKIFNDNYPPHTLNLLEGLQTALDDYFNRKAAGRAKANGATIVVVIDGEPRDRMAIVKTIVSAAEKLDSDQELGIGFAQIGEDIIARGFLESLDDDLRAKAGAKFDIVATRVLQEISPHCLTDFLQDIICD